MFQDYTDPGERFALRELQEEDIGGIAFMNKVTFFSYLRHVKGPEKFLREAIAAQSSKPRLHYIIAIVLPDRRNELIGIVGAIAVDDGLEKRAQLLDVGYCLIPDFQKLGIARAAFRTFLARIITPKLTELTATVDPDNAPSIRLLETCGFERHGSIQESKYLGDPANPAHYLGSGLITSS